MSPANSNTKKSYKKTREGGRDFLEYDGYKYRVNYSNPLNMKSGKLWSCTVSKCTGTLRTEMSFGDMLLFPRDKHNHSKNSNDLNLSSCSPKTKTKKVEPKVSSSAPHPKGPLSSNHVTPQLSAQTPNPVSINQNCQIADTSNTQTPLSSFLSDIARTIDWDKTPVTTSTIIELKSEVRSLTQVIIEKELVIEDLMKKSENYDVIVRDLKGTIQALETNNQIEKCDKETNTHTSKFTDSGSQTTSPTYQFSSSPALLSSPVSTSIDTVPAGTPNTRRKHRQRKGQSATEQEPHKNRPLHLSRSDTARTRKVLIVSDSMGRGLAPLLSTMLPNANISGCVYPNAKFNDVVQCAADASEHLTHDDYLVILAGTNNTSALSPNTCPLCCLPYGNPADLSQDPCFIADKNMKLLKARTNLIICAIPFRYDSFKYQNRNIHHLNKYINQKCSNLGISFMNVQSYLKRSHYTSHGLHLKENGKHALSMRIEQFMRSCPRESVTPAPSVQSGPNTDDVTTSALAVAVASDIDYNNDNINLAEISCPNDLAEISIINIDSCSNSPQRLRTNTDADKATPYSNDDSLLFLDKQYPIRA
uniref:FLYWCH-type domain-containing protein n=1 Tax=Cacopsylla melanoneura TaxID=428564 RepID=A0A8D8YFT8_9HEMI